MPVIEHLLDLLKEVYHYLHVVIISLFFGVGIVVAARDLKERLADYSERLRDTDHRYRVRTTIVKDMMDENETQTAKLRRLRVSKRTDRLVLDPWPTIIPVNGEQRLANLSQFYSVPGRLGLEIDRPTTGDNTNFRLLLSQDEALEAHREYPTLLIYTMEEDIKEILTPPGFIAVQPVGEECFTYEVHFPPNRRFVRSKAPDEPGRKDKPKIRVFKGPPEKNFELAYESYAGQNRWIRFKNKFRTRYHVLGGSTDFGDRLGMHDWFRVTVLKPPQDEKIYICWCMEGDPTSWDWCSHTAGDHKKK